MSEQHYCKVCNSPVDDQDLFCSECGASLSPMEPAAAAPPYAPPPQTAPQPKGSSDKMAIYAIVGVLAVAVGYLLISKMGTNADSSASSSSLPPLYSSSSSSPSSSSSSPSYSRPTVVEEPAPRVQEKVPQQAPRVERPRSGPASFPHHLCSGRVRVITRDGSLLNIRPAPGQIDPVLFQVPTDAILYVDGWAWDIGNSSGNYWFRVTDEGGYVLGWISQQYADERAVSFPNGHPYSGGRYDQTESWEHNPNREYTPSSFSAYQCSGSVTVASSVARGSGVNVRPAPGMVGDVVYVLNRQHGIKVNGWSYDLFDSSERGYWLRVTDNKGSIVGWINSRYVDTRRVKFHGRRP